MRAPQRTGPGTRASARPISGYKPTPHDWLTDPGTSTETASKAYPASRMLLWPNPLVGVAVANALGLEAAVGAVAAAVAARAAALTASMRVCDMVAEQISSGEELFSQGGGGGLYEYPVPSDPDLKQPAETQNTQKHRPVQQFGTTLSTMHLSWLKMSMMEPEIWLCARQLVPICEQVFGDIRSLGNARCAEAPPCPSNRTRCDRRFPDFPGACARGWGCQGGSSCTACALRTQRLRWGGSVFQSYNPIFGVTF